MVVAWDAATKSHVYMPDADVAFEGGVLRFVGRGYDGPSDEVVSGSGMMVMPGLVNIHSHPSSEPMNKGLIDEIGSPGFYNSSLYEYLPIFRADAEAVPDCVRVALSELLLSGVTTLADLSMAHPGWLDLLAEAGMRVCIAPMFRSARWFTRNGHVVEYDWSPDQGFGTMEKALQLLELADKHPSGRLSGMVCPAQIDTCSPELLQTSYREASKRGLRWQTHAAQSLPEFHEITRRHGLTPIQWLEKLGVLGPTSIVGHAIFVDDHPNTHWSTARDVRLLAESRTTVAHCPTVFMRRGMALCHVGRYLEAGVNIGIGTDTYPHNMIEEMRHVGYVSRLMAGHPRATTTADVFNAATIGGARALGRDDIGRLAAGAKADFAVVNMKHPLMQPSRDPIRSLVYAAADRAVSSVYVDGEQVVADGRPLRLDYERAS